MRFEVWTSADRSSASLFSPDEADYALKKSLSVQEGETVLKSFEAADWNAARAEMGGIMGWTPPGQDGGIR